MWKVFCTLCAVEQLCGLCARIKDEDAITACHEEIVGAVVEEKGCEGKLESKIMQHCACVHKKMVLKAEL